jgi:hypothetical protein
VAPATGWPSIIGGAVLDGAVATTRAVGGELCATDPDTLLAVSPTRMVWPTSPEVNV